MPRALSIVSIAALVVFLSISARLGRLERAGPPHGDFFLAGRVPATLFLPAPPPGRLAFLDPVPLGERPPAIVLVHGFAADRVNMSALARRLAGSGYAVLTLDLNGHGQNRNPFDRSWRVGNPFHRDLSAAVDFLRSSPLVDGSRVAVMGHSMGAGASLDYATRDSGIDAAVMISGGWKLEGPYRPPNALFLYASGDPPRIRDRSDAIAARLAGVPVVERSRSYGDPEQGTALRVVEVPGVDHVTIVWSGLAAGEILAWLDAVFGIDRPAGGVPADPRLTLAAVGALALLCLLPGLGAVVGRLVPGVEERPGAGAGVGLLMLAATLGLALPVQAVGTLGPILSVEVGDVVFTELSIAGVALLVVFALARRSELSALLRDPLSASLGAAVGVMGAYLLMAPLGVVVHRLTLGPERVVVFGLLTLAALPFSLAFNLLLRRGPPLRSALNAIGGRILVLLVLVAGVRLGVVSGVVMFLLPAFAFAFVLLEVLAVSIYATSRNVLTICAIDAAWLALVVAASMPIRL